jgi:predicted O-methyltransferase YrrM
VDERVDRVLREIEVYNARNSRYLTVPREVGKLLGVLTLVRSPKAILEIGSANGYSTVCLANTAKKCGAKFVSIEESDAEAKMARENLEKAGLQRSAKLLVGPAALVVPKLKEKFDFVFLNARKEDYLRHLQLVSQKLGKNAVLVAGDAILFERHMRDYLQFVRTTKGFDSVLVPMGSGVEVTVKA